MALLAELRTEPQPLDLRGASRRTLRLEVESAIGADSARVVIRNLSETGLLLETEEALSTGDTLAVELPEVGAMRAQVVWGRAPFFGCEFESAVSRGAIAAALLKSPIEEPPVELLTPVDSTWAFAEPLSRAPAAPRSAEAMTALVLLAVAASAFVLALAMLRLA